MERPLNLQDAIFNLQKYLRAISFADKRVSRPPLDGIFDSATEDAVRSFQASRGLNANGIVDRMTWDAIYDEYKALALAEELPRCEALCEMLNEHGIEMLSASVKSVIVYSE